MRPMSRSRAALRERVPWRTWSRCGWRGGRRSRAGRPGYGPGPASQRRNGAESLCPQCPQIVRRHRFGRSHAGERHGARDAVDQGGPVHEEPGGEEPGGEGSQREVLEAGLGAGPVVPVHARQEDQAERESLQGNEEHHQVRGDAHCHHVCGLASAQVQTACRQRVPLPIE